MKKKISQLLLLLISFAILSCAGKSKELVVKVSLKNNVFTKAYLYGFWGDNQILIDSISADNNTFAYDISKTCNVGVYRILFSTNQFIDFIFNNENVEISADTKDFKKSITIMESSENKLLYSYFNSIQKLQDEVVKNQNQVGLIDSTSKIKFIDSVNDCNRKEYSKIYTDIYKNAKNKSLFAYSIIQLLDMPKYEFYSVNSNSERKLSKAEFLSQNCFSSQSFADERLIATPYLFPSLQVYLDAFSKADSLALNVAVKKLYMKSIGNPYISTFMNNLLFEYLYDKDYDTNLDYYMDLISQGTLHKIAFNGLKKSKLIHLNEYISKSFEKYYKKSNQTILLLCDTSSNNNVVLDKIQKIQGKLFAKSINVCIITPSKNTNWNESCSLLNIPYSPAIILIDSKGKIVNRIFGKDAILEIVNNL
jgi:hypothetical protein